MKKRSLRHRAAVRGVHCLYLGHIRAGAVYYIEDPDRDHVRFPGQCPDGHDEASINRLFHPIISTAPVDPSTRMTSPSWTESMIPVAPTTAGIPYCLA